MKWVDLRPEIDPVSGAVGEDDRSCGASDADQSALEWALRCAQAWGDEVVAVTAGPHGAESLLRDALARGASSAVRVELERQVPSSVVASALATVVASATVVWCGDRSLDRATGSVPAFLAGRHGGAQALGLVQVVVGVPGQLEVLRRLDGGRRERLRVRGRAVLSVEGATARLRRASLPRSLTARNESIAVVACPVLGESLPATRHPFRPRPKVLEPPRSSTAIGRVAALVGSAAPRAHSEPAVLGPDAAAERILEALTTWGYRHST